MKPFLKNDGVMTVAELKAILKDWPEVRPDGEPTEVWIGTTGGTSNGATSAYPLDMREEDGGAYADLIISP